MNTNRALTVHLTHYIYSHTLLFLKTTVTAVFGPMLKRTNVSNTMVKQSKWQKAKTIINLNMTEFQIE